MTSLSFIVTSYNIAPYIDTCLQSIMACARPHDQIILVDDGSSDETPAMIRQFAAGALPADVEVLPILLGTNTWGGVGIGANIGLDHAQNDTVFFVDGDDWLDVDGFNQARDLFQTRNVDFLLANYTVYDEHSTACSAPADSHRWAEIKPGLTDGERLTLALSFIAVPWRKFYRRRFLQDNNLRFPEGDFFYEDNPFHWDVCCAAASFSFVNRSVCYHRVNRAGQTMAATGTELLAFFTHYQTLLDRFAPENKTLAVAAMRWLVNNMSWHLERLHPLVRRVWAKQAMIYLQAFDDRLWQEKIAPEFVNWPVGEACEQLRGGDLQGFLTDQKLNDALGRLEDMQNRLGHLQQEIETVKQDQHQLQNRIQAQVNTQEYAALLALHKSR